MNKQNFGVVGSMMIQHSNTFLFQQLSLNVCQTLNLHGQCSCLDSYESDDVLDRTLC